MTIDDLRASTRPISDQLEDIAQAASRDDFAPEVCDALKRAAFYARLSDNLLSRIACERVGLRI